MASRSILNVFEITDGRPSAGLLPSSRADIHAVDDGRQAIEDDGLGCIRALPFAIAFNVLLVAVALSVWELWKHWR